MGIAKETIDKMIKAYEQILLETTNEVEIEFIKSEIERLKRFKNNINGDES